MSSVEAGEPLYAPVGQELQAPRLEGQHLHHRSVPQARAARQSLATMQAIVPWAALCEVIALHYPKPGNGRPPVGLERMLHHCAQHWFNLADLACEESLYDSASLPACRY